MLVREPVYQQLNNALREMLISGDHKVGDKFLTEREICQRFAVSRTTANKAISNMVSEGVLEFKKGIGTFVRTLPLDYDLRSLVSFTRKAREAGRVPGTRLLAFEEKTAGAVEVEVKDRLKVGPSDRIFFCQRLRLADDIPMIVERRYLVAKQCEGITEDDLRGSIYSFLTDKKHVKIIRSEELDQGRQYQRQRRRAAPVQARSGRIPHAEHRLRGAMEYRSGSPESSTGATATS